MRQADKENVEPNRVVARSPDAWPFLCFEDPVHAKYAANLVAKPASKFLCDLATFTSLVSPVCQRARGPRLPVRSWAGRVICVREQEAHRRILGIERCVCQHLGLRANLAGEVHPESAAAGHLGWLSAHRSRALLRSYPLVDYLTLYAPTLCDYELREVLRVLLCVLPCLTRARRTWRRAPAGACRSWPRTCSPCSSTGGA